MATFADLKITAIEKMPCYTHSDPKRRGHAIPWGAGEEQSMEKPQVWSGDRGKGIYGQKVYWDISGRKA